MFGVCQDTSLYPKPWLTPSMGAPLYLRLEGNYISEDAIQQKVGLSRCAVNPSEVAAGIIRPFSKSGSKSVPIATGPKANLVVKACLPYPSLCTLRARAASVKRPGCLQHQKRPQRRSRRRRNGACSAFAAAAGL